MTIAQISQNQNRLQNDLMHISNIIKFAKPRLLYSFKKFSKASKDVTITQTSQIEAKFPNDPPSLISHLESNEIQESSIATFLKKISQKCENRRNLREGANHLDELPGESETGTVCKDACTRVWSPDYAFRPRNRGAEQWSVA